MIHIVFYPLWKHLHPSCFFAVSMFFLWYLFVPDEADSRGTVLQTGKPGTWSDSGSVRDLKWLQQRILNQIKRVTWAWDCRLELGAISLPELIAYEKRPHVHRLFCISKKNRSTFSTQFRPTRAGNVVVKGKKKKSLFILSGPVTMSMTLLISG